jgi:hypothetical protein
MLDGLVDFKSKMFLLGSSMIVYGIYLATGIDIPNLPEHEILGKIFIGDSGTLINGGFAMIFAKHRIDKVMSK